MGWDNEIERMDVYSKAILNLLNSGMGKGEGATCRCIQSAVERLEYTTSTTLTFKMNATDVRS